MLGRLHDHRNEVYLNASYGEPGSPRVTVFYDVEHVRYESRHRIVQFGQP